MLCFVSAKAHWGKGIVTLYVRNTDLPTAEYKPTSTKDLYTFARKYAVYLTRKFPGADLQLEINQQNLYNAYRGAQPYKPSPQIWPEQPTWDVDLVTPLDGWKGWSMAGGKLSSLGTQHVWEPLAPHEAVCSQHGHVAPYNGCSCGVYGALNESLARGYGIVHGHIYGWGRYILGTDAWRCQYAYPKDFVLKPDQMNLIEQLREYRVPIYMMSPTLIYSPQEDGYANGTDETNWHERTSEESDTSED